MTRSTYPTPEGAMDTIRMTRKLNAAKINLPLKLREAFPGILTVSDATENVFVKVTGADRKSAQPHAQSACAMARSCVRALKVDGAFIGLSFSYLVSGTHATRYITPESVSREIVSFDRNEDFSTGTYHLTKVNRNQRLGYRNPLQRPKGRKTGTAPRGARRVYHRTSRVRAA